VVRLQHTQRIKRRRGDRRHASGIQGQRVQLSRMSVGQR
jgi:hypothetical protein